MTMRLQATARAHLSMVVPGDEALTADKLRLSIDSNAGPWHAVDGYDAGTRTARVLVGPGSPVGTLEPGLHRLYVDVTSNPEQPVLLVGRVYVEQGGTFVVSLDIDGGSAASTTGTADGGTAFESGADIFDGGAP